MIQYINDWNAAPSAIYDSYDTLYDEARRDKLFSMGKTHIHPRVSNKLISIHSRGETLHYCIILNTIPSFWLSKISFLACPIVQSEIYIELTVWYNRTTYIGFFSRNLVGQTK